MNNRTEIIINGVRHLMTDTQMGNLVVDITPEQIEAIKLQLARERGEPEPILYDDEPATYSHPVDMDTVAEVVAIQVRMETGMEMIKERKEYKRKLDAGELPRIDKAKYAKLNQDISRLWEHWFTLRNEVQAIVGDNKAIWAVYFQIDDKDEWLADYKRATIQPYFTNGDTTEVDEGIINQQTSEEVMEELLIADLLQRE